ncbi:MAG TPA: VOC family protein [Gemmatirosa sp.]
MPLALRPVCPYFEVFDMPASLAFYRDALGFEVVSASPLAASGAPDTHGWAWLRQGGAELMLNTASDPDAERPAAPDPTRAVGHADVHLYIGCADVDAMYAHLRGRGLDAGPPHVTSYGMREVSVCDPDGFTLNFLSRTDVAVAAESDADDAVASRSPVTSRGGSPATSEIPGAVPEIPVQDVAAATAYYEQRLGFTLDWGGEALGLAGVSRGRCRLFLADPRYREAYGNVGPTLTWLNLTSKDDVDALYHAWNASGARVMAAPESKPWGLHEFTAADLDGNLLRVFYDVVTAGRDLRSDRAGARLTSFAPQFLVDDLARSVAYYRRLGFDFGEPWGGYYAIGVRDGLELHLKAAPKHEMAQQAVYDAERQRRRAHEHLDAAAGVDGIEAFYARCVANGATVLRPLGDTAWGTKDFYLEDPDGYVLAFGGRPVAR